MFIIIHRMNFNPYLQRPKNAVLLKIMYKQMYQTTTLAALTYGDIRQPNPKGWTSGINRKNVF